MKKCVLLLFMLAGCSNGLYLPEPYVDSQIENPAYETGMESDLTPLGNKVWEAEPQDLR